MPETNATGIIATMKTLMAIRNLNRAGKAVEARDMALELGRSLHESGEDLTVLFSALNLIGMTEGWSFVPEAG